MDKTTADVTFTREQILGALRDADKIRFYGITELKKYKNVYCGLYDMVQTLYASDKLSFGDISYKG